MSYITHQPLTSTLHGSQIVHHNGLVGSSIVHQPTTWNTSQVATQLPTTVIGNSLNYVQQPVQTVVHQAPQVVSTVVQQPTEIVRVQSEPVIHRRGSASRTVHTTKIGQPPHVDYNYIEPVFQQSIVQQVPIVHHQAPIVHHQAPIVHRRGSLGRTIVKAAPTYVQAPHTSYVHQAPVTSYVHHEAPVTTSYIQEAPVIRRTSTTRQVVHHEAPVTSYVHHEAPVTTKQVVHHEAPVIRRTSTTRQVVHHEAPVTTSYVHHEAPITHAYEPTTSTVIHSGHGLAGSILY